MAAQTKWGNKTALQIGPFSGGINTYSDPSSIADSELVDCVNYDVSLDGTLVSRPPIRSIDDGDTIAFTQRINLIGTANISGTTYIFGANTDGTFRWSGGAWTLLHADYIASTCVQYNNVVYFVFFSSDTNASLAKWTPSGGWSAVNPANLNTMMGSARAAGKLLIYKDRMFIICGGAPLSSTPNRVIFSDAGNPESYTATTQFVDVNPGDGQVVIDGVVQDDNLILFKNDSTYVFTFTSTPADAELVKINSVIGVWGLQCVVPYENAVYVLHRGKVYEIVNYNFTCVNVQVPFAVDTTAPTTYTRLEIVSLSLVGDRLVVRWANRIYVLGLRTKTWTRWESANDLINNVGMFVRYLSATEDYYLAGSCLDNDTHLYKFQNFLASTVTEKLDDTEVPITCSIVSKNFDLGDPFHYKRLHWWGVDGMVKNDITGSVSTVVALFSPTWQDIMDAETIWDDFGTWGHSASTTLDETTIEVTSTNILRSYFRFPRSVRFRQAFFTISTTTDGSSLAGPVRLFGITIVATAKELVPKGIN